MNIFDVSVMNYKNSKLLVPYSLSHDNAPPLRAKLETTKEY